MNADTPTFTYQTRITLRDADAAGRLFFARYLTLAHEAYEAFMRSRGLCFERIIAGEDYMLPVIHAQCDYRRALPLGETVTITLDIAEVRTRAFTVAYQLRNGQGELAATVQTVHAPVSKTTGRAIRLPENLRSAIS